MKRLYVLLGVLIFLTGCFIADRAKIYAIGGGGISYDAVPQDGFTIKTGQHLVLPVDDDAATPTLGFGTTTGFYSSTAGVIDTTISGTKRWYCDVSWLGSTSSGGALLNQVNSSAIFPSLVPDRDDLNTGTGRAAADQLSLIAGGVEGIRILEANSKIYTVIGGAEADQETDGDTDGTTTITSDGATGDNFSSTCATGDMLFIYGGTTAADYGPYRIVTVTDNDNLVLDRAPSGTNSDVDFVVIKDGVLIEHTDGTNGQRIVGCSHQDKPLQIGGDALAATGHSLGAEDLLIGGILEVNGATYMDSTLDVAGSITSGATADPMLIMKDSDASAGDNNYVLDVDATDTGDGTEDIDVTEQIQRAGATITPRYIDADQTYQIGTTGMPVRIMSQLLMDSYHWIDEFDQGNAADAVDEIGAHEAYWTVGGTAENDNANFANGVGGVVELQTNAATQDHSTSIIGEPVIAIDSNPIVEFRFKVDDITNAVAMVGLTVAAFVDVGTPNNDCIMIGLEEENGVSADAVIILTNDNGGGAAYQDTGINVVNNTWVTVRFDLTDEDLPRVWINNTEMASAVTGDLQAGQTLMVYAMVQALDAGQRKMTIDFIKVWQDRG